MSGRKKILVLADEIMSAGPPPATRLLVEGLARQATVTLVAQCYLPQAHRARRPGVPVDLYGFDADTYEADVVAFAAELKARHAPDLIVAYGWENAKLVVALDELDLPIISFVDHVTTNPTGQGQLNRIFQHATEIVLHKTIPPLLEAGRWALEGRVYKAVDISLDAILRRRPLAARLRGRLRIGGADDDTDLRDLVDLVAAAGARAAASGPVRQRDRSTIAGSGLFNRNLFDPRDTRSAAQALDAYLRVSRFALPRDRIFAGRLVRRPLEGFNPMIYASDCSEFDEEAAEDPFAHWLRSGRPTGRWTHEVIRPGAAPATAPARLAIHAHLHYPDLLAELLERLATNATPADLFITTTSDGRQADIAAQLRTAGIEPRALTVYPNLGRDIWPFISLLDRDAFRDYDAVGHFHGKRSPHIETGADWRDFLGNHLIGGKAATLDAIAARFAADPSLGLVFAEEPHLDGWEHNKDIATDLAQRARIDTPLPNHFEYPMGTMFWVRPAALAPLLALGLTAADIPPEPVGVDGTLLHAIERLIPFFVAKAGFGYATTYVRASRR